MICLRLVFQIRETRNGKKSIWMKISYRLKSLSGFHVDMRCLYLYEKMPIDSSSCLSHVYIYLYL